MNKIKWFILPVLMIVSFVLVGEIPTKGAMTPNVDYPPNQADDLWTQPSLTYSGQYVISLNGTSNTSSKSIAISIPMTNVMYFVFTYYDINMNAKQISSLNGGFNHYENVLIDSLNNNFDVYVQSLENELTSWKLEVYTIFDFVSSGGNTGTWRTNILNFAYVSQSPLLGQLSVISEVIYESAYNKGYWDGTDNGYNDGYIQGENDGYNQGFDDGEDGAYLEGFDDGYDNGESDGYDRGLQAGSAVTDNVFVLFEAVLSSISNVFKITIFPGVTIGTLFMIPISFAMFKWFLKLIK